MNNNGVLAGKTAVITAAASGMGKATAKLFASEGAHVVAVDIADAAGALLRQEVMADGGSIEFHRCDLTSVDAIRELVASIGANHQHVDCLFNHAGMPGTVGLDFDPIAWQKIVALNLTAPIALTELCVPLLSNGPSASVIFTSSIAGLVASPSSPTYSAVKSGVIGFMRAAAAMLGQYNVRSNAICPSATETPMLQQFFGGGVADPTPEAVEENLARFRAAVPLGRVAQPEEVAELALFLASDRSSYITGVAVPIDGGYVVK